MSGDSAFVGLRKVLEKSVGDTENLRRQLRDLQMPKSPSETEELKENIAAFNEGREALLSEFVTLKDLIEQYRKANFLRVVSFDVGASIPHKLEWADFDFSSGDLTELTWEGISNLFAYALGTNSVLRAHITHDLLPELFNRRRDQDNVSETLKAPLQVLGRVFDENFKLFVDLVLEVLLKFADFVKEFAPDLKMTLADWILRAIDFAGLTLNFIQRKAEDLALVGLRLNIRNVEIANELAKVITDEMGQVSYSGNPSITELLAGNPGPAAGLAIVLIFAVWDHWEIKGFKLFKE
jgi:hypothetical protein